MRKEILNGTPIPYDLSIEELKKLITSSSMKDFSVACEVLSFKGTTEAYEIMKPYINVKDKYRRLYTLKTIFRYPQAIELVNYLENAIASDDLLFVNAGLLIVSEHKIKIPDSILLLAVTQNLSKLYTGLNSLSMLKVSEDHYFKLIEIYKKAELCSQRKLISDTLIEQYLPSKSKQLFDLFRYDKYAKIRLLAIKLAKEYGYNLSTFLSDIDGHVKKLAMKSLGELSFLSKYIAKYRIDISDDLESAIIYNPISDENIYIEYDKADESSPFLLSFSFQHVHLTDKKSATEWIDEIISENLYTIEYFSNAKRLFGGEITAEELNVLSYEFLEQDTGYFGITKLFQIADRFKVRGWSGKNDFDGQFVKKDGKIEIYKIALNN